MVVAISVFAWVGFGSTVICETAAQRLICANAIWPRELVQNPLHFVLSFLTAPLFHNGLTHMLLIMVCLMVVSQTAEIRLGTQRTITIFFFGQLAVGTLIALLLNVGASYSPSPSSSGLAAWFHSGLSRNWMGGSVGLYFLMGALFARIERPILAVGIYLVLDMLNLFVLHGAASHTVLAHVMAVLLGVWIGWRWRDEELAGMADDVGEAVALHPAPSETVNES